MRTMLMDGGVQPDVINKLWQVYSTEQDIPKPQRQGAIIILGMLAIARRDIVTERVDSLLKIGLGPLGMVRSSLLPFFLCSRGDEEC